jgi:hypothetical protein
MRTFETFYGIALLCWGMAYLLMRLQAYHNARSTPIEPTPPTVTNDDPTWAAYIPPVRET